MPSREQLIEQLRKLEALARDVAGTPEGKAARRKIRELMDRYGITAGEVRPRARARTDSSTPEQEDKPASRRPFDPATVHPAPATITFRMGNLRIRLKL